VLQKKKDSVMKKKIEKIIPQPAAPGMVGDGFRVFNYIPGTDVPQQRISPFLMLDFNAEVDFPPSEHLRGVDVHPHKGFETVTISYKGSVAHHDSAGNSGIIHPGDVQWMTAGGGILHKEYHEKEYARKGGPFEMVQLWVNLPKKDKQTPAHYQGITKEQMGKVILPDGQGAVNVIAGNYNGIAGPAQTYTPVNLFDIKLRKGGSATTSLPAGHNTAILVIDGSATINGQAAAGHSFVLFANEGEEIEIRADEDAVLLVLSGEPLNEPIASYGPFVMNTQAEIIESIREFQAGKFGVLE
jgi:redox-sensitive bicupin YhaK (pirin superfamily)